MAIQQLNNQSKIHFKNVKEVFSLKVENAFFIRPSMLAFSKGLLDNFPYKKGMDGRGVSYTFSFSPSNSK